MAAYPGTIAVFTTHHDLTDVVDAADPNTIQAEVAAVESTLGVNPHVSTSPSSSGSFSPGAVNATVSARMANIETGLVADSHTQYVHKAGGDTILQPAGGTAISIKAGATPTQNVWQVTDNGGTAQVYVDKSLGLYVGGVAVITAAQAGNTSTDLAAGQVKSAGSGTSFALANHLHGLPPADGTAATASFRTLGTGAQQAAAGNHTHSSLAVQSLTETKVSVTANSATTTLDCSAGTFFVVTLQANTTIQFSNVPSGVYSATVVLIEDATGGRTTTWTAAKWGGATQPTQDTTANHISIYSLFTMDSGTTWYAFLSGKGMG